MCISIVLISLCSIKTLTNVYTNTKRYEDKSSRGRSYFSPTVGIYNFDLQSVS